MGSNNTLYVFVDESGVPGRDSIYSLAGAWTLSHEGSVRRVLEPTVGRLRSLLEASGLSPGDELKGSKLGKEHLNLLLSSLKEMSLEDSTVYETGAPWPPDLSVRFSVHEINQDLAGEALGDILGSELQVPVSLQTLALASILSPFVQPNSLNDGSIDECVVVLDANTWEQARQKIERGIDILQKDLPAPISLQIRDSAQTPGIQIADLAAYSWRRNLATGECVRAVNAIHECRFKGRS